MSQTVLISLNRPTLTGFSGTSAITSSNDGRYLDILNHFATEVRHLKLQCNKHKAVIVDVVVPLQ